MAYIIENVHLMKGQALTNTSMLVEGERIITSTSRLNRHQHMKMDADKYIMTPTHVLFDSNLPLAGSFKDRKEYYLENFIMKGSTVIFTPVRVQFERQLEEKLKQAKNELLDSPIDFVLGISIPLRLLKPQFIRKCKKMKIPAIFLEIEDIGSLETIPWGWIKEALFPYNCPIIPLFSESQHKKEKQQQLNAWSNLMKKEKVPALYEGLKDGFPVSRSVLKKTGIFPGKSNLHSGGEVSYNLYNIDAETKHRDEQGLFFQSKHLVVTVDKGKVIRAGKEVYYRPGKGENVIIKTPGFFTDNY
ncbi:hypothetical protein J7E38_01835 [Bacillus sp. ISL-35]|uniref:hypothetical protein n=1 Tax=Bacillus sp. ISL-35 TaxID=2819122 RepID=UPI001BE774F9|nr:hypothetical protein [Bacillus sp. ISL-35]MBT2677721.1 hypothetical protein [Bacillus sp. ISL-35]MBT2704565.1 hypothetical protein [Chryseobacterium sp. ISL-80]